MQAREEAPVAESAPEPVSEPDVQRDDKRRPRKRPARESAPEATLDVVVAPPVAPPVAAAVENGSTHKPENLRGAEGGETAASAFAQSWFSTLLDCMDVEGTAVGTGAADRVHLSVKAERAGRIVGKRGATLGSIRHLLGLALENRFGPLNIDVDVGDDRPREDREARSDRPSDRPRGDRAPRDRGDRPERAERPERDSDRSRGPRRERERDSRDRAPRDRGGRRDTRSSSSSERGRYPEEKLRALARRAAEKAVESGQTITINLELNSFDRRIVHLEVGEMKGVGSESEERTGPDGRTVKYIQIFPQRA